MIGLETGIALKLGDKVDKVIAKKVTNLDEWEAVAVEWRCPESQCKDLGVHERHFASHGLSTAAGGWGWFGPPNIYVHL